jgi:ribosome biogenesis GTPase
MQGTIIALDFGQYLVDVNGDVNTYHLPKTDKFPYRPVVGDRVEVDKMQGVITHLLPRHHFLIRPRIANLDHLYVVMSLVEPQFSLSLLFMFMSFAKFYALKVSVIITKVDLAPLDTYAHVYAYLNEHGHAVYFFNKREPSTWQTSLPQFQDQMLAFAGQTGAGKSSILNALNPDYKRLIGSYSTALGRGKHQTKEVILFPYHHGYIADTPGFSSLVLPMIKKDLTEVFPGFSNYLGQCKFSNCTHRDEPGCTIKMMVESNRLPKDIYEAYRQLVEKLPDYKEYA